MLQLNYRYHREIDRVERSAIRKICEMDDIAAKRMILFVAQINRIGFDGIELELCDGWYSLPCIIDDEIKKFVYFLIIISCSRMHQKVLRKDEGFAVVLPLLSIFGSL